MAALRVVSLAEVDLDAVAGVVNRAFGVYANIFTGLRTSPSEYAEEAGPEARVMLVEEDGRLVATSMVTLAERFIEPGLLGPAGMERDAGRPAPPIDFHPWSGALYYGLAGVEPELMNRGFGRLMVEQAERLAAEAGSRRVALGTVREFGLVEYYQRFGYYVVHEEPYEPGHWDFVVDHCYCEMVKDL
jgi:GNAT superfamily N-acetyltransferase